MNDNIQPFLFALFFGGGYALASLGTPIGTWGWIAIATLAGFAFGSLILLLSRESKG